jgi:hypothetical protein
LSSSKFLSESSSEEDPSEKEGEETASTSSSGGRGCFSSSSGDAGSTHQCCDGWALPHAREPSGLLVRAI